MRHVPAAKHSLGDAAVELAAAFGLVLDPWQRAVLRDALRVRDKQPDKWASFEVGLVCARQNGKGAILEARELAGALLFGERLIVHCLDIDTPMLTTEGWKTMGSVKLGDSVFHPSGKPVEVVGKSPIWLNQHCFQVTTTDGREVIADADHLWTVFDRCEVKSVGSRGNVTQHPVMKTMTTKDIYEAGVARYPQRRVTGLRFTLPRQHPLDLPEADLPLDPYILGAWLGDGSSWSANITTSVADRAWWEYEIARLGVRLGSGKHPNRVSMLGVHTVLNDIAVYRNKHIPQNYVLASARQREALLQGLMDTDGSAHGGRACFTNTNEQLARGVLFLARSLGWRAVIAKVSGSKGGFASEKSKDQFKVSWTPKLGDDFVPFRMPRKVAQLTAPSDYFAVDGRFTVSIESIEPVTSRPVACIRVDSDDGLFLAGDGLLVTHNSAHEFKTAKEAMRRLEGLLAEAGEPYKANRSHGEESIEFKKTGSRVMFQTRTKAGGRGLSGDLVILDEAMILSSDAVGALLPTMSARPNPQLWYTGSAVDQAVHANGLVFTSVRERGLSGEDESLCWQEWSCEDDANVDDPEQWLIANPGVGYRISLDHIAKERRALLHQPKVFAVERLSIGDWPQLGDVESEIPFDAWSSMASKDPVLVGARTVAVHRSRDRRRWAIAAAQRTADNRVHIELGPVQEGSHTEIAEYLVDKVGQWNPIALVIDRKSAAMVLEPLLLDAGIETTVTNSADLALACGGFLDDALAGLLSHSDQPALAEAAGAAVKRDLPGGGFAWDEGHDGTVSAPLVAATLAHWALLALGKPPVAPSAAPVVDVQATKDELDVFAAF